MAEEVRVRKWNPVTKAHELTTLPYDVKPIYTAKGAPTANGAYSVGTLSVEPGKYAIITGIKLIAESADTWFSIGGDISDVHYLPAKGADIIAGSPEDPYAVLDEGQTVTFVVENAVAGVNYAVTVYGAVREKKPQR